MVVPHGNGSGWGLLGIEELTVFKYAFLHSSIEIGKGALSVLPIISPLTNVFGPIGTDIGALPMLLAILIFTDVYEPCIFTFITEDKSTFTITPPRNI